jgi:serine protease inhibitor
MQTQQRILKMKVINLIKSFWGNKKVRKLVQFTSYQSVRRLQLWKGTYVIDLVNLGLFPADFIKEPTTYDEALNFERKEDQIKWKDAINKYLNEMTKGGVREVIDEKEIPDNC